VIFGLAWLTAGTHLVSVSAEGVLAVAVMVLGAAVVITARTDWALSRRRWPLWLGAGLMLALIVSTAAPNFPAGPRGLRIGSQTHAFTDWSTLPPAIDGGVGSTRVDLTGISAVLPQDTMLRIRGGLGSLSVVLPRNLHVHLDAHVGAGSIAVNGQRVDSGLSSATQQDLDAAVPGHTLTLDVNAGAGSVRIDQPATSGP
jgi:hypothetical protein